MVLLSVSMFSELILYLITGLLLKTELSNNHPLKKLISYFESRPYPFRTPWLSSDIIQLSISSLNGFKRIKHMFFFLTNIYAMRALVPLLCKINQIQSLYFYADRTLHEESSGIIGVGPIWCEICIVYGILFLLVIF